MSTERPVVSAEKPWVAGADFPHALTAPDRIPAARYTDPAFFELERDRLWSRVWQMACRLDEIPEAATGSNTSAWGGR